MINPEEEIPSYLEILPFIYTPGMDGSATSKITDAWVYVEGEFLGAFELPKTIPILSSGSIEIFMDAGIKENGINLTPNIYPFYKRFTTTVDLVPGEVTTIQPRTAYDDTNGGIQLIFNEGFNDGVISFTSEIKKTTIDVREGDGSGLIELDSEVQPASGALSIPIEKFPENNFAYLEVDYKADVIIRFGVIGFDELGQETFSTLAYGVNPKDEWNKIYFNYTDLLNVLAQRNTKFYQIQVQAGIPIDGGDFTLETAEIRLDNMKLISF